MARRLVPLLVIASFALLVFAFAGCGGDDNSASGDTTATETTTTEDTTTETETTETETTETETTETETTEDEGTDTTEASGDFATSENCQEFASIGTKISEALAGTGGSNLEDAKEAFDELTAAAPDEIKDDFQVIADAYSKMVDALQGVDLSDPNPDAATLQKLTQLGQELDQAKLTQASTNISTWAQENC